MSYNKKTLSLAIFIALNPAISYGACTESISANDSRVSTTLCSGDNATVNLSDTSSVVNERYYSLSGSNNTLNLNLDNAYLTYLKADQKNRGGINIISDNAGGGNRYILSGGNANIVGGINAQLKDGDTFELNLTQIEDGSGPYSGRSNIGTNRYDNERGLSEPNSPDISMVIRNSGSSDISLTFDNSDVVSAAGYGYSIIDTGDHSRVLFRILGISSLTHSDVYTGTDSNISLVNNSIVNRFNITAGDRSTIDINNDADSFIMQISLIDDGNNRLGNDITTSVNNRGNISGLILHSRGNNQATVSNHATGSMNTVMISDHDNVTIKNEGILTYTSLYDYHTDIFTPTGFINNKNLNVGNSGLIRYSDYNNNNPAQAAFYATGDNIALHNTGTVTGSEWFPADWWQRYELDHNALALIKGNTGQHAAIDVAGRNTVIINDGVINGSVFATAREGDSSSSIYVENGAAVYASDDLAAAITLSNADDITLALRDNWAIEGDAIADTRSKATLKLTGNTDSTLDLTRVRDSQTAAADGIIGFNQLTKDGAARWTLTGTQTAGAFSGASVAAGELRLQQASVRMADNATAFTVADRAVLSVAGHSVIDGGLALSGTLNLNTSEQPDNTLTVTRNFHGENGNLLFGTVLGDDNSATTRLVIEGDASGSGHVSVTNLGGQGAETTEGIRIISVSGNSAASFTKAGRIVAGAYDYDLTQKDGQNWYLTSMTDPGPRPQEPQPEPKPEPQPEPEPRPQPEVPAKVHQYRPEGGSYLANLQAANTLFHTRLHDRIGDTQYTDMLTGEQKATSMWMRHVGDHNRFRTRDGQLKTQSNSYVVQLGGDIARWSTSGLDRWHLGIMAGYGNNQNSTHSGLTGYRSRGHVTGYSAGIYGTWYANEQDKTGSYVDA